MKKTTLGFHKNVTAPRSPFLEHKVTNKTSKNSNRSASNQNKPKDKSKSKPHSTKGKNIKASQSPADKEKKNKGGKNAKLKKGGGSDEFLGRGKNIYTGKVQ